jgi:hypothetical protein
MVTAARAELANAGVTDKPRVTLADAGYWNHEHMDKLGADGIAALIPPESRKRKGGDTHPGWHGGRYTWMRHLLATDIGDRLYRKPQFMIEAVFGQTERNRGMSRFGRRGRSAVRTEWRLIAATHNLVKLLKHQLVLAGG